MMILECKNVIKNYGKNRAVDNVSLKIEKGEIYGLIGVNGAGKSTLLKMVLGIVSLDEGSIRFGDEIIDNRVRAGAMIEANSFYNDQDAFHNLKYFQMIYGEKNDQKIKEVLELVGLSDAGKKRFSNFSLGMRQRLGIALALLYDSSFIILDEPLNGLDPLGIAVMRELIVSLQKEKDVTFLISSHNLPELSQVATRFGIMHKGRLLKEVTDKDLKSICQNGQMILTDRDDLNEIRKMAEDVLVVNNKMILTETCDRKRLYKMLEEKGIGILGTEAYELSLEDYFRIIIKRER